jgi:hypothetical protein
MGNFIMSAKEIKQASVFEQLQRKEISQKNAAILMNLSERQIRRKLKSFESQGLVGLAHKNRGRICNNRWDQKEEALAIELLRSDWVGFGPTFTAEKLQEYHNIKISRETLRNVMIKCGIWVVNERKIQHRKRRERRTCFGMMIQLDGSPHDWFEGRGPRCTLLVFIDDATSKIVWLEFAESESLVALMQATRNYLEYYGIPNSFYVDYGSVFSVNADNAEDEKITQYGRMMKECGIKMIYARSPQAKGRVERSHDTHQDRLVKELRLKGISNIQEANLFLCEYYTEHHNLKFAKVPADATDVHRPIKNIDLDKIMCIKEERTLTNDFTIVFNKQIFQLEADQRTIIRPKNRITVNIHMDGAITLSIRAIELYFKKIETLPIKEKIFKEQKPYKPSANSRRWVNGILPVSPTLHIPVERKVG